MSSATRVSIILTCYREGPLLRLAIASALKNLGPETELIIVNDASPDVATNEICKEASAQGLKVLRHASNGGLSTARNTAARQAQGEIFVFLDGDDLLPENTVPIILDFFDTHRDFDFVCGNYLKMDIESKVFEEVSCAPLVRDSQVAPDLLLRNWILPGSSPVRRSLFERIGGYDESSWLTNAVQDIDFYQRAFADSAKGGYLDRVIYLWRIHDSNMHKTQPSISYPLVSLKNRRAISRFTGRSEQNIIRESLHSIYACGDWRSFRRLWRHFALQAGVKNHLRLLGSILGIQLGAKQRRSKASLPAAELQRILAGATPPPNYPPLSQP